MEVFFQVNWLAISVATLCFAALGALWFTFLVPQYYTAALGRERAGKHEQTPRDYAVQVGCLLATTATSAVIARALNIQDTGAAAQFGLLIGLGYFVPVAFTIAINPNFPRPILYGLINAPFFVLGSVLANVVLVAMH